MPVLEKTLQNQGTSDMRKVLLETLIVMPLSSVMAHINTRSLLCSSVDAYALWDPSKLLVNGLVLSESVTSPTVVMLVFNSIRCALILVISGAFTLSK